MSPEQRARALRLIESAYGTPRIDWKCTAVDFLRELAAEQPHCGTCRHAHLKEYEYPCKWCTAEDNYPKREPNPPQAERKPLTDEQVATVMSVFYSDAEHAEMMFAADLEKCRAVERAHGIGCGK